MHADHRAVQKKLARIHAEAHELRVQQLAEFDACFCAKQVQRIAALPVHLHKPVDAGGQYSLEVKGGSHPHTVQLSETPDQLLRKEGEAGYRKSGSLTVVPGS